MAKAPLKFLKSGKDAKKFPAKKPGVSGDTPKERKALAARKKK